MAREQMLQAKLRMHDVANQNRPQRTYEVGDYVMLRLDHIQLGSAGTSNSAYVEVPFTG